MGTPRTTQEPWLEERLERAGLRPMTPADADRAAAILHRLPAMRSELTKAGLLMWQPSMDVRWTVIDDVLFTFWIMAGELLLLGPPLVPPDFPRLPELWARIFDRIEWVSRGSGAAVYVPREWTARLSPSEYQAEPKWSEYLYDMAALARLEGSVYASRRQEVAKFTRLYRHTVEPIGPAHVPACRRLLADHRKPIPPDAPVEVLELPFRQPRTLTEEYRQSMEAWANATILDLVEAGEPTLKGIVIRVDGELVAFSIGTPIGRDEDREAAALVQKTNKAYYGLATFAFHWNAKHVWSDYVTYNLGDDFGVPGLQKYKELLRPKPPREAVLLVRPPTGIADRPDPP
jgi:hypothetical protein